MIIEDGFLRRSFDAIVFAIGGTEMGSIFFAGSTTTVGVINDGDIDQCAVERSAAGEPCLASETCGADLICIGSFVAAAVPVEGICVSTAALPGEGEACHLLDQPCPRASGLVCSPLVSAQNEGQCLPAWVQATFTASPLAAIPSTSTIFASGLATVATFARVDFFVAHPQITEVVVSLRSPADPTPQVLFDGAVDASSPGEILAVDVPVRVPGDEAANGAWELIVSGPAGGQLLDWSLTLGSRFD